MFMQVCFLLQGHKCFVTNGRNSHFSQTDARYKALEDEHTHSLSNLDSQLHAYDRLEGSAFRF